MSKRLCLVFLLIAVLILSTMPVMAVEPNITLTVSGKEISLPDNVAKPYIKNGEYMVPAVKAVLEPLGLISNYDGKVKAITLKQENNELVFTINSLNCSVNGKTQKLKTAPVNIKGWIYMPLSVILDNTNHKVEIDNLSEQTIIEIYKKVTTPITINDDVIVVDTTNLVAPKYDSGYSQIDVFNGMVGFNKNSNVGIRPSNSSLTDDVKKLNETALKNTTMGLASNGSLDMDNGTNPQSYFNTWFAIMRNSENNPVFEIRGWGYNESEYSNKKVQVTMNLTAEALKYYCGSDAESIWAYINNSAVNKTSIASDKTYQFGNTLIKFNDPKIKGIDVVILGKAKTDVNILSKDSNVIVVDTTNLVAPKYDSGYSQIDVINGMVGFNKNSIIGTRPTNSSLTDDVKKFNETVLKNTGMGLAPTGSLDMDNANDPQSYNNTWLKMYRDSSGNPVLCIRGWARSEDQYSNMNVMATMNLTAEMLKYYCGSDAESIWSYIDNAAVNEINIASDKPYQFGNTLIKFVDPNGINGIDVVILGKAK